MPAIGHRSSLIVFLLLLLLPWSTNVAGQSGDTPLSSRAYKHLLDKARNGSISDQTKLGISYQYGSGIPRDLVQAEFWLHRAAGMGNPEAQLQLGVLYLQPEMVAEHGEYALRWFIQAAASGLPAAEFNIGIMYLRGLGTAVNFAEAERWLRQADRHGVKRAKSALGVLLLGSLEPKRKSEGFELVRKSAKDGDVEGRSTLAYCYEFGIGVEPDLKAALRLYLLAAKSGNLDAMYRLGVMYYSGKGVQQDFKESFKWMKTGCDGGDAPSCWSLGSMYLRGDGVKRDLVLAYTYIGIGRGNPEVLAKLAPVLSEEEKAVASTNKEKWEKLHAIQLSSLPPYRSHTPVLSNVETTEGK